MNMNPETRPADEMPVEEKPVAEMPVEEMPVEETPVEETPVDSEPPAHNVRAEILSEAASEGGLDENIPTDDEHPGVPDAKEAAGPIADETAEENEEADAAPAETVPHAQRPARKPASTSRDSGRNAALATLRSKSRKPGSRSAARYGSRPVDETGQAVLELKSAMASKLVIGPVEPVGVGIRDDEAYILCMYKTIPIYIPYTQFTSFRPNIEANRERVTAAVQRSVLSRAMVSGRKNVIFVVTAVNKVDGGFEASGSRLAALERIRRRQHRIKAGDLLDAMVVSTGRNGTELNAQVAGFDIQLFQIDLSVSHIPDVGKAFPTGSIFKVAVTNVEYDNGVPVKLEVSRIPVERRELDRKLANVSSGILTEFVVRSVSTKNGEPTYNGSLPKFGVPAIATGVYMDTTALAGRVEPGVKCLFEVRGVRRDNQRGGLVYGVIKRVLTP